MDKDKFRKFIGDMAIDAEKMTKRSVVVLALDHDGELTTGVAVHGSDLEKLSRGMQLVGGQLAGDVRRIVRDVVAKN